MIPLERPTAFHGALTLAEPSRELVVIAGAGHNDIFHVAGPRYFEAILGLVALATGGRE